MTERLTLRPYQEECVAAHFDWFARNKEGHPLFVVPTAAGKSLIIAEFVYRSLKAWPDCRFIVPTHVQELVDQNFKEFCRHSGASPWNEGKSLAGVYSAGLRRRDVKVNVLFCSIQSVWRRAEELGPFDVVLVDEAHMIPKKGQGRYRSYLDDLREINPDVRVCGYTATHYRLGGGYLHEGADRLFTDVAYEVPVEDLVPEYLLPLVSKAPKPGQIDTSSVTRAHGDFKMNELEAAATQGELVELAVDEIVRIAQEQDRKAWLLFATTLRHAEMIADCLRLDHEIEVACVFGDTPRLERQAIVERFRDGEITAVVNVGVLTTGFNAPRIDLIALLRPTQSTSLYVQMLGRGMRKFEDLEDCLVLDYGGNVLRHGPINAVRPRKQGSADVELAKVCPDCDHVNKLAAIECEACGYMFTKQCPLCLKDVPLRTKTCEFCGYEFIGSHEIRAGELAPFDPTAKEPKIGHLSSWHFVEHPPKPNKPPTVCVTYICGLRSYKDWICPEHGGYASRKADRWWTHHGGFPPFPQTAEQFLERIEELRQPDAIEVVFDGNFDRVKRTLYKKEAAHDSPQ